MTELRRLPLVGTQRVGALRILLVIHGYPMAYNAGSEVYTQTLAHALVARGHDVHVFSREEDPFRPDYALRQAQDDDEPRIGLSLVNMPRSRDRYRHAGVDQRFAEVLDRYRPDVVHVGHLNHLSTSLLNEAAARQIPIVYTLHDYWLMCPRGQFMQMFPRDPQDLWAVCDGQEDRKCAERCYARYFSGAPEEHNADLAHWTDWVGRRMAHVRQVAELADQFIAPSTYLGRRFEKEFRLPAQKITYLDYGFDHEALSGRRRRSEREPFTFGYIGTQIPAKGIQHLLQAFGQLDGGPRLRIWGRPRAETAQGLKLLAQRLPGDTLDRIEWLSEYRNSRIVPEVFDRVDAIVVASVWVENSPLVIHEAQQARVPVITADAGGMQEYVEHEVNGLLFRHRDHGALAKAMQRLVDDPELARRLGQRGYVHSASGDVPSIVGHVDRIEQIYRQVLDR